MKSAIWNVEYGHDPVSHATRILYWFEQQDIDVLCITEGRDYLPALRNLCHNRGHQMCSDHGNRPGSDQCFIIVKQGIRVDRVWSIVAGNGWNRVGGGKMQPMQPLCVEIEGKRIFISAHAPVGAWVVRPRGRAWVGAKMRRLAYRGFTVRLAKVFNTHPKHSVTCWADWNASPTTRGMWSPNWLREQVKGVFMRPHQNTGHGEIDFAITDDEKASRVVAENPPGWPGDHLCVIASHQ